MGKIANQLLLLNSEKHAIRAAINAAAGEVVLKREDPLSAYPAAIADAASGSKIPSPDELLAYYRIIFIDWDGTILKDCYVKPGDAVEAPAVPTHDGLVFAGWTKTEATLQAPDMDMVVGATYTFQDDIVYIEEIFFPEDSVPETYISLVARTASTDIEIDWGDGSAIDAYTVTPDSEFDGKFHAFPGPGTYVIKVHLKSGLLNYAKPLDESLDGTRKKFFTSLLTSASRVDVVQDTTAVGFAKGALTDMFTLATQSVLAGVVYPNAFSNAPSIAFNFMDSTYGSWPLIAFVDGFEISNATVQSGKYLNRGFLPVADIPLNASFTGARQTRASREIMRFSSADLVPTAQVTLEVLDLRFLNNQSRIYTLIGAGARYVRVSSLPTPVQNISFNRQTKNILEIARLMPTVTYAWIVTLYGFDDEAADEIIKILNPKGYTVAR